MIEIRNGGFQVNGQWLVQHIDYQFEAGKIYMICGPNGAGKSTFLKLLSLEKKPGEGEVFYNGQPVDYHHRNQYATIRAVLSQHTDISFPIRTDEIVMMGRYPHFQANPTRKDHAVCEEVIRLLEIEKFSQRNYLTLSGGEKQRVQFARVLAQLWDIPADRKRILLLDEPIASLDLRHQFDFLYELKKFMDPRTIVIAILHDLNLALNYGDEVLLLQEGKLFASGKPAEVLHPNNIEKVFHIQTELHQISNSHLIWVKERS